MEQELATTKRPGQKEFISKEEFNWRIKEIAKCKRDIVYFAEHYFRVVNLDKGLHIIQLYDIQKDFLRFLVENNKIICCSGRQQGKSTIYCIYSLWLATFYPEQKIMMLANKAATALELLSRVEIAYQYLPSWIKSAVVTLNKGEITFANLSSIRAFPSSSDAARGFSARVVILDEFAFLQKNLADKLFTSMYPVISSSKNGKFIIVSTPKGTDNLYYDIWQQANSKDPTKNLDGWKPFEMYWWQVPGHDEEWKKKQIAAMGATRFAQEFNNEFLADSTTRKLIPDDILEKYRIELTELKVKNKEFYNGKTQQIVSQNNDKLFEFTMWHAFNKDKTYVASGDVAEGVGGDASVLYIWDITDVANIQMCARFSSNEISVSEFAFIMHRMLSLYGNPYVIMERNGVSSGALETLSNTYKYENIVREGKNRELGVFSHVTVKGKTCLWAREMMTTDGFNFKIYDKELLNELGTFVKKDTKGVNIVYSALHPAHDDHVMAFIWLTYVLQSDIIEKYYIVCKTFTSTLGNTYAKIIQPQKLYTKDQLKRIVDDPIYQDFLDFRDNLTKRLGKALQDEEQENSSSVFKYSNNADPYFGGYDADQQWNRYPTFDSRQMSHQPQHIDLNPANRQPQFYIF